MSQCIRVFDARGKLVRQIDDVAVSEGDENYSREILDLIGCAIATAPNQNQQFTVRVENENGKGFWMVVSDKVETRAKG
jgi:hypothetical protein